MKKVIYVLSLFFLYSCNNVKNVNEDQSSNNSNYERN